MELSNTEQKEYEDEVDAHTGYSFSSHSEVMQPDQKKYLYTKSVVNVTKRTLARYMILNKCFCLFMIWIHGTMALLSIIISYNTSVVLSESTLCRYIFYASHYFYGYIHVVIAVLYIYLLASFTVKNWENLRDNDWLALCFILLAAYVALLKVLSELNCTFWSITASQIVFQGVQFAAEGVLLKMFYTWLHSKAGVMKQTLEENVDFMTSDYYAN